MKQVRRKVFLYRVNSSADGSIKIGNVYFDEGKAYNAHLPIKPLNFNDDLNFIMGYGDISGYWKTRTADASRPENYQWFSFGKKYRYKIPVLKTQGSILGALTPLATTTGSTFSVDKNIVTIQNRLAKGALATSAVMDSDTEIDYEFANGVLPEKGYLLIGSEVVKYTGKTEHIFHGSHTRAAFH